MGFQLSHEVKRLKRSVLRELLGLAVDPDIISLAGGLPANENMPVEQFRSCLNAVLDRDGAKAMQYSPQYAPLRNWIAEYMTKMGVACEGEQIFITNGAQQGLAILSRLLLDPGDPAVVEEITFTGIHQITLGRGAALRAIPTDHSTGADMQALEAAFRQDPRPRFAVLIPDFHNPLGVSLSKEKRARAAALAEEYGVAVIEDDPYSALRFSGDRSPPIKAFDNAGNVFYVGSFSKMLAPSIRLGWIVAAQEMLPAITVIRESFDLESSTLTQRAVMEFFDRDLFEPYIANLNALNLERSSALMGALEEHLSDVATWTRPEGGLFSWVSLHNGVDTWDMFEAALDQKVAYIPGAAFAVNGGHRNTMRLNFSNATPAMIREAIARLTSVIQATE